MSQNDPFDLARFVMAQDPVYDRVCAELGRGRKSSHWMWFIFPQIAGLGFSAMSQNYALSDLDEAQAYLDHPLLRSRLQDCTQLVLDVQGKSAHDIFGSPDDLKFHSSMTLFAHASTAPNVSRQALIQFLVGQRTRGPRARFSGRSLLGTRFFIFFFDLKLFHQFEFWGEEGLGM